MPSANKTICHHIGFLNGELRPKFVKGGVKSKGVT